MTLVLSGRIAFGTSIAFWALDGVCGLLPAANANERLRVAP